MASVEEITAESLKYQTLVLKVSIYCEGCKKKVKKVLQGIEGVYNITVDSQKQKVTVNGNVNADTLIKKLLKAGKHAEVWPENPAARDPTAGGGKMGKKKGGGTSAEYDDKEKRNAALEEDGSSAGIDSKHNDVVTKNGSNEIKKYNGKNSKAAVSTLEKIAGEERDKTLSASGDKRKAKKAQCVAAPISVSEGKQVSQIPPQTYQVPGYPSQTPVYVLSYNSSTPAAIYGGAASYAALMQSNYLYSAHQPASGTCYIPGLASAQGSYDFFSEENANSCNIM